MRSHKEDVNIQKVLSSFASAAFEMPEESRDSQRESRRDSQRESQISRETSKNRIKIEVLPNNAFSKIISYMFYYICLKCNLLLDFMMIVCYYIMSA